METTAQNIKLKNRYFFPKAQEFQILILLNKKERFLKIMWSPFDVAVPEFDCLFSK